jgi:hypothetical protein
MATCRRAGFTPDARHLANSIPQLAMVACGFDVTLVPNATVARIFRRPVAHRPLTDPADIVELSLVTRANSQEPLVQEFLRIASGEAIGAAHLE